ncbi:MAG: hypothetical protein A2168_03475 [Planctomycetes bacterium RBG_13_50_24]|nr:MAG: hypothetical protein A2168_03475 [Planctomycetes bacterium RBG_13_50_24]
MIKKCLTIALITTILAGGCNKTESENGATNKTNNESEKMAAVYTFLLAKLQEDKVISIASEDDDNLGLIQDILRTKEVNYEVENPRFQSDYIQPQIIHSKYERRTTKDSRILAQHLSEQELQAKLPDIYHFLNYSN